MAQSDQLRRLAVANNASFDRLASALHSQTDAMWLSAGDWRDTNVASLVRRMTPVVQATMLRVAGSEAAYIGRTLQLQNGIAATPLVERAAVLAVMSDPDGRLSQPAIAMRAALAKGKTFSVALEVGKNALGTIIDLTLTDARAAQQRGTFLRVGITHFHRVASSTCCAYCKRVIGTGEDRYLTNDLRPLHPKCSCGVAPEAGSDGIADGAATAATERERQYRAELKARKTDPEERRRHLESSLEAAEARLSETQRQHSGIEALPVSERAPGRRAIGIGRQQVASAKRALAAA